MEPMSVRRVERAFAWGLVLTRAAVMASGSAGVLAGYRASGASPLYLSGIVAVIGWSVLLAAEALRRDAVPGPRWGIADVIVSAAALLMLGSQHQAQPTDPQATLMWTAGLAGNVCAAVGLWARRRADLAFSFALVAVYLTIGIVAVGLPWSTTVVNAVLWSTFTLFAYVFAGTWRSLAAEADEMRRRDVAAAEQRALDRARCVVHDPAAILRMIADPATPPASLAALRTQAALEARRLRSFMADQHDRPGGEDAGEPTVAAAVRAATRGFDDLPLEVIVDLAEDSTLHPTAAASLTLAVTTCLHNVREHAAASTVVVHADAIGDLWEVVVRDDGRGFDPGTAVLGHGLRTLVKAQLAAAGVRTQIDSAPGEGCAVILTGTTTRPEREDAGALHDTRL